LELTGAYRQAMDRDVALGSTPERRWMLLSHVLFGVTLGVPTIVTVVSRPPGAVGTLTIAAAFAVWYIVMFAARPDWEAYTGRTVAYAVGALAFYTALNVRDDGFFLLLYALLPQFFSSLPRWLAVLGVVGIVISPAAASGDLGSLLTDRSALFSVLASVGLALAVTAVIDALDKQATQQAQTIDELEQARADNVRLLDRAQRDLRDRSALARAGHALIAARSPADVAAALGQELAEHSAGVRGVALLRSRAGAPVQAEVVAAVTGTANPRVGAFVDVPRRPTDDTPVVLTGGELTGDRIAGITAVALLSLGPADASEGGPVTTRGADADLLWLGLEASDHSDRLLRDLATIATETSLTLANLRLASHAASQGRTAGVLAERQRLAHEIHDTLAQGFTSIVTQLEAAEQALEADTAATAEHIARAKDTARDSLREARRTVEALRPEPLERAPLPDVLRDLIARWSEAQMDAPGISVVVDGTPARMSPAVDDALLRVAQEALTNVGRHAAASQVDLTLSYLDDLVLLDVQDDGVGFDVSAANGDGDVTHGGYGLTSMRERVALVGGALVVESAPTEGTTVAARVPRAAATPPVAPEDPT
jgi:signal transduction histidine kinase